jgi:cell wall-associated NlpC family hydrolase
MATYSAQQIYGFARAAGFSPDQAVTMTAIALAESDGNSNAHNPRGEDSRGLWQINLNAHAAELGGQDLYDPLTNARAAFKVSRGGEDISPWTVTHGGDHARYTQFRHEAQAAAVAYGDGHGLGVWTGVDGFGDRVAAGADMPGASAFSLTLEGGHAGGIAGGDPGALDTFLDAAKSQAGDRYVFGAEAAVGDHNPDVFDCSELVQWAAAQAGVDLPDGSWLQYQALEKQGAIIPVEQAINTPGALLFRFSSDPSTATGRPSSAHVAISLGNGETIEARGRAYGVGSFEASEQRFQYAAVIPGLAAGPGGVPGLAQAALPALDPNSPDTDRDGLTDALEARMGLDPRNVDSDADDLSDAYELMKTHTDPTKADTDRDGLLDAIELALGFDPTKADTDHDGRIDTATPSPELEIDTDHDGLTDALEKALGTDFQHVDSDGDGFADGLEYHGGFDLLNPASNPLAPSVTTGAPGTALGDPAAAGPQDPATEFGPGHEPGGADPYHHEAAP